MPQLQTLTLGNLESDLQSSLQVLSANPTPVIESRKVVERALRDGKTYYGINTGFGILANKRIPEDELLELQRNLILSHAVGVGPPTSPAITKLMLGLKIHALGLGYSGVSIETFRRLVLHYEQDWIPVVPSKGSLGASGDLAPLSHMSLPLIGKGFIWDQDGSGSKPTAELLKEAKLDPVTLQAKDGLALINGTQFMLAHGVHVLGRAQKLATCADLIAAMSLEALQGSSKPFDTRIHEVRKQTGQSLVAKNIRTLLAGSEILDSHRDCGKVQDPYSLRCIPQVHGAARDALAHCITIIEREMNSVTDNPLVFPDGSIISGGNFHGEPLALALDYAAMALAEFASISERRLYLLLEGHDGLPTLLMEKTGTNSGFMIPQYTAASLVSENKVLAHPASVDSIPSSLGQEDHVSMGSISATKLLTIADNLEHVLAIELLTAAQALDYRAPLGPGLSVAAAHARVRQGVPHREKDAEFQEDIQDCLELLRSGDLLDAVRTEDVHLL